MLDAHSGLAQASALDLSQNGIGHFGIPRQHARLNHVSTLMVGRLWGFVGVDILQTSTKSTVRKNGDPPGQREQLRRRKRKERMRVGTGSCIDGALRQGKRREEEEPEPATKEQSRKNEMRREEKREMQVSK